MWCPGLYIPPKRVRQITDFWTVFTPKTEIMILWQNIHPLDIPHVYTNFCSLSGQITEESREVSFILQLGAISESCGGSWAWYQCMKREKPNAIKDRDGWKSRCITWELGDFLWASLSGKRSSPVQCTVGNLGGQTDISRSSTTQGGNLFFLWKLKYSILSYSLLSPTSRSQGSIFQSQLISTWFASVHWTADSPFRPFIK